MSHSGCKQKGCPGLGRSGDGPQDAKDFCAPSELTREGARDDNPLGSISRFDFSAGANEPAF